MENTLAELRKGNTVDASALGSLDLGGVNSNASNELTSHERFLDKWRIVITLVTVVALFTVVMLILFTGTSASSASPYVSLLSGLAGIALGWMFAGSGAPSRATGRGKSATSTAGAHGSGKPESTDPGSASPAAV
jgi:hypothetical protein